MGLGRYRVERLELWDGGIAWDASLVNLFSQLNDGELRRFRTTAGSDSFGSLVTPAF